MNDLKRPHNPDPEFASRLRWQLASEFRRRERFAKDGRRKGWIKTTLVLAVALLTGFAAATATQHYQEAARKELLIAQEEALVELAKARLELAGSYLDDLEQRYREDSGLAETLAVSRFELHQIERELGRNRLNLQEITITGSPPRDSLTAPTVFDRDFVSERLHIEEATLLERDEMLLSELSRRDPTAEASDYPFEYARLERSAIQAQLERIQHLLRIRRDFLEGRRNAREVVLQSNWADTKARLAYARQSVEAAEEELERTTRRLAAGKADPLDVKQAEFQVMQAKTEQNLALLEQEFLMRKLSAVSR